MEQWNGLNWHEDQSVTSSSSPWLNYFSIFVLHDFVFWFFLHIILTACELAIPVRGDSMWQAGPQAAASAGVGSKPAAPHQLGGCQLGSMQH